MAESEIKLTIGEEKVDSKDVTKGQEIDLKFRDPEKLHDEMRVGLFSPIFLSRLAPVLKTIFHQCAILYTCSKSYSDGSQRHQSKTSYKFMI